MCKQSLIVSGAVVLRLGIILLVVASWKDYLSKLGHDSVRAGTTHHHEEL